MVNNKVLKIKIDSEKVIQLNKQGWKLCFASGLESNDKVNFNVIASTHAISTHVTIQWVDSYSIAASQDSFSNGVIFNASTDPVDIDFKKSYTLEPTWVNGTINDDPSAPEGGFTFINNSDAAAAVVYKKVNGKLAPIYFSAGAPLPKGTETLVPVNKVAVWFAMNSETATMISKFNGESKEVDMTGKDAVDLEYQSVGGWKAL